MNLDISLEMMAFIAIICGIIGRTYFPYLKKKGEDVKIEFDARFIVTAIFTGVISAVFIYPTFIIPEGTMFEVFIAGFVFAWGANDAVNRIVY